MSEAEYVQALRDIAQDYRYLEAILIQARKLVN